MKHHILSRAYRLAAMAILLSSFVVHVACADGSHNPMTSHHATDIVVRAYQQELQREPDPDGMATFVQHLLEGKSERWVHDVLSQSSEAQAKRTLKRKRMIRLYGLPPAFLALGLLWGYGSRFLRRLEWPLVVLLALAFAIPYFILILRYAVDIPSWDDFPTILGYSIAPPAQRFQALLAQHNEHRIAMTRLVTEGVHALYGRIDFKVITIIGNSSLLGIYCLFARGLRAHRYYLPVLSGLLFAPVAWLNMTWSMAAVQNNGVHLFALVAITLFFSASPRPLRVMLLALVGALSVLTSGAGIFLFPAVLFTLIGQWLTKDRRNSSQNSIRVTDIIVVLLLMIIVSALYFTNYTPPNSHPSVTCVLQTPLQGVIYFLSFVGASVASAGGTQHLSSVFGAALFICFVTLTLRGAYRRCPVLYSFALYLLITGAAAMVTRLGFGVSQALDVRYRVNSILFMGTLLVMAVQLFPSGARRRPICGVAFAGVLLLYSYSWNLAVTELASHRKVLIIETARWLSFGHGLHYPREEMPRAGKLFDTAVAKGLYRPPQVVLDVAADYDRTKTPSVSGIPRR